MEHDLIAISAKCQKGEGIDTLNLLGIIHCLTGVFSEGRQILLEANSPTWSGKKAVNPSSQWDVKLSLLLSLMAPLPFLRWDSHSVSHFSEGGYVLLTEGSLTTPTRGSCFCSLLLQMGVMLAQSLLVWEVHYTSRGKRSTENLFVVETGGDFSFLLRLKQ